MHITEVSDLARELGFWLKIKHFNLEDGPLVCFYEGDCLLAWVDKSDSQSYALSEFAYCYLGEEEKFELERICQMLAFTPLDQVFN